MNSSSSDFESREASRFPWVSSFLGLGLIVSLSGGVYQHSQIERLGQESAATRQELAFMRQSMAQGEDGLKDALEDVRQDVAVARGDAARGIQAARNAVAKAARKQDEKHSAMAAELGTVKTAAEQAAHLGAQLGTRLGEVSQEVGGVKNEVGSVRTDVAQTRGDLEKAVADLKRTTGDLGILSGLVATNGKELAALRELGERDYVEFTLNRDKTPRKVGEIMVSLKKTDLKRNRYTIEITADDKRVEKKDRGINEPVQFYVASKARQPYELVVNQVKPNEITGYLAVPKAKLPRRG
ncbi:MAG: hypothetical protein FJW40_17975 [Acidobacteria bacterium]|nr:hypothetical protein [Acidobacteriota bacterium]